MEEKKKNKKYLIIVLLIFLIAIAVGVYFCLFYRTESQKETIELSKRVHDLKNEMDEFNNKVEKEAQDKLDLLEKGYDVPTKSYFSSPENIKLQYKLKEKGYKFYTTTIKNENSTYFSNENYSISCIIDINTNAFINIAFWDKSLKGNACDILNINNNISVEEKEQYSSYLQWLNNNDLSEQQVREVLLDYYLDNK